MMDGVLGRVDVDQYDIPKITAEELTRAVDSVKMGSIAPKVDYNPIIDNKVSHPNHYQSKSGLECKDVIEAATEDLVGYEAVYTANIIKYIWRWKKKNGDEDLRKAKQYIDFILDKHLKEAQ